jgi:hypothetical protein
VSGEEAPPPPEESKMEFHQPKPWHDWREFLKEYVIIVLGVATALAAEQTVEALHNHERAAQARTNIRAEIAANIALIDRRTETEGCVSRRLNEVEGLIRIPATGSQAPVWIGHPPNWLMTHDQYAAAVQSGAISLLSNLEQVSYSHIYSATEDYSQAEKSEQAAWADLRILELRPAATPVLDGLLRSALQKARDARWQTEISARVVRVGAAALGIEADKKASFPQASACIPLNTTREEGEKLVIKGRPGNFPYDEP